MRTTDDTDQTRLLAEYQANVDLWKHDDTLRQQRAGVCLGVNTALVAALGVVASLKPPLLYVGAIALLFSLFGLAMCAIWHVVQLRNAEYVRFRRFQLRSIESRLPGLSTFQNVYRAFYDGATVRFEPPIGDFAVRRGARRSSTLSEAVLPFLIGGLWLLAAIVAIILLGVAPDLSQQPRP